jgi:hypothetical protein
MLQKSAMMEEPLDNVENLQREMHAPPGQDYAVRLVGEDYGNRAHNKGGCLIQCASCTW